MYTDTIQNTLHYVNNLSFKQILPNGVLKLVQNDDSLASLICQNPELASNLENTLAILIYINNCP